MSDYRHHTATRDRIIFVEVPVAGSPKQATHPKPPAYPRQGRDHPRLTKAQRNANFVRAIATQDADVRRWLDSMRRIGAEKRLNP
jgi:hypothetical protein